MNDKPLVEFYTFKSAALIAPAGVLGRFCRILQTNKRWRLKSVTWSVQVTDTVTTRRLDADKSADLVHELMITGKDTSPNPSCTKVFELVWAPTGSDVNGNGMVFYQTGQYLFESGSWENQLQWNYNITNNNANQIAVNFFVGIEMEILS